jgi:HNH endonuclease
MVGGGGNAPPPAIPAAHSATSFRFTKTPPTVQHGNQRLPGATGHLMPIKGSATPAISRFAGKFNIDIQSNCWNWTGSRSSQAGYPTIGRAGSKQCDYAHRVSWETVNGPMPTTPCPDGSHRWELHHECENKGCINPAHISLVTHREHMTIHREIRAVLKAAA